MNTFSQSYSIPLFLLITAILNGCGPSSEKANSSGNGVTPNFQNEAVKENTNSKISKEKYISDVPFQRKFMLLLNENSDPKNVDDFIEAREIEVRAKIDFIDKKEYAKSEHKVIDLASSQWELTEFIEEFGYSGRLQDHLSSKNSAQQVRQSFKSILEEFNRFAVGELKPQLMNKNKWPYDSLNRGNISQRVANIAFFSDDFEFKKKVVELLNSVPSIRHRAINRYAELVDVIEIFEGRMQIYGTQGECISKGEFIRFPSIDIDNLDTRRREMKMSRFQKNQKAGIIVKCRFFDQD